jgi:SAM-dependent methyltransferase
MSRANEYHTTSDSSLVGNPLEDVLGSILRYSAILTAGKLGVFRALDGKSLTLGELAGAISASEQGTQALAEFLVTLGYLKLVDQCYGLGPVATRWFRSGDRDFTPVLLFGHELWNVLWELPQAIRAGKPTKSLWERWADRPEAGRDFSDYMKIKSELTVQAIADAAPIPAGARRLIDLGGSHGLHASAFCRRYPELTATVMDLPEALANTGKTIAEWGLSGRISLKHGDFLRDPIGDGYDVVLLCEIVHNHTPEDNRKLIKQAADGLNPGGVVIILEDLKRADLELHNTAFSLSMFACSGDRTYSYEEITGWCSESGLVSAPELRLPSSVSLVTATKHHA